MVSATIAALLDETQMVESDVVSVTTHVVEGQDLSVVMAARDRSLGGHRAASALVVVAVLARPEWLVEVSVVAGAWAIRFRPGVQPRPGSRRSRRRRWRRRR